MVGRKIIKKISTFTKKEIMGKIILDTNNNNDLNLILHLAQRLGVNVKKGKSGLSLKSSGKKLAEILQKLADAGGIEPIPDPLKWQKATRSDRQLPSRLKCNFLTATLS